MVGRTLISLPTISSARLPVYDTSVEFLQIRL